MCFALQFDWKQQHAADLARRQLESKQALGQLAGSLKCLEDKLHEVMAQQSHFHEIQARLCKPCVRSGRHSDASSTDERQLIPARLQSASRTSSASLDDTDCDQQQGAEQVALARKAAHVAKWVQQSSNMRAQQRSDAVQSCPAEAAPTIQHQHAAQQDADNEAEHKGEAEQLVSCQLSHQEAAVSVNLHVHAAHDSGRPSLSERQQRAAQTRYAKWLMSVCIVEDACSQLNVRNHNPGPGVKSVTYAQLLRDCANSVSQ